ncbi:prepilin-type N-terminal cleavage/methylation domain-containing protein [Leptolyngbya sp. 15MV]|nr:prepilin-type N-terminal cleavage/methylation domain-containing protein [Leptolyngbya sp. 15MV]
MPEPWRPTIIISPRRGFSVVELLIALTISSLLLSACLVALDSTFKSYQRTTESASSHVVSRLVMYRVLSMIRQGTEFAPYPLDVIANPRIDNASFIEFVSNEDGNIREVTRIERVADPELTGTFRLQFTRTTYTAGAQTAQESGVLINNLRDASFTLLFDIGPRLIKATVDLTVLPDDVRNNETAIATGMDGRVLRFVASTSPRRLDE